MTDPYPDPTGPRPDRFHPTKEYVFASAPAAAQALADVGVDVIGLGNNHMYDLLEDGITQTEEALTSAGFQPESGFFGAGSDADAAWRPAVREVRGTTVAFLGCTTITGDEHPIAYGAGRRKGGPAACDADRLAAAVEDAGEAAEVVVVAIHGGYEYERDPSPAVRTLSEVAVDAGAVLVVNHHPHVVGGLEWEDGHLIAWTLGNLLFDQTVWPTFGSYVLKVAVREGAVVSAWIEPVRLEDFQPVGVTGDYAEWVASGVAGRSAGPWRSDIGSVWLEADAPGTVREEVAVPAGLSRIDGGCPVSVPDGVEVGGDQLWTGHFEHLTTSTGRTASWNVGPDEQDRTVTPDAARRGDLGVRLRRSPDAEQDIVLTTRHRVLVEEGDPLTVLLDARSTGGDATLQLSWYNGTRGASQERTLVPLPGGGGTGAWRTFRLDVETPVNAVAVGLYLRLAPSGDEEALLDVDDVQLVSWGDAGSCSHVRAPRDTTVGIVPPLPPSTPAPARPIDARPMVVPRPPALPPGPEQLEGGG